MIKHVIDQWWKGSRKYWEQTRIYEWSNTSLTHGGRGHWNGENRPGSMSDQILHWPMMGGIIEILRTDQDLQVIKHFTDPWWEGSLKCWEQTRIYEWPNTSLTHDDRDHWNTENRPGSTSDQILHWPVIWRDGWVVYHWNTESRPGSTGDQTLHWPMMEWIVEILTTDRDLQWPKS